MFRHCLGKVPYHYYCSATHKDTLSYYFLTQSRYYHFFATTCSHYIADIWFDAVCVYSSPHLFLNFGDDRYFMLMFGLNDVYSLVLGESSEMDEANRMMHMQMGGMMGQQPGFDANGMYRQVTS